MAIVYMARQNRTTRGWCVMGIDDGKWDDWIEDKAYDMYDPGCSHVEGHKTEAEAQACPEWQAKRRKLRGRPRGPARLCRGVTDKVSPKEHWIVWFEDEMFRLDREQDAILLARSLDTVVSD